MVCFPRTAAALALACLMSVGPVIASDDVSASGKRAPGRTLSLDDVLAMETFGAAALSPDGAWAVYERRRPYDTAPRFDRAHRSGWAISDLMIARTDDGQPERLLPPDPGAGLLLGPWSPDSRRLVVYRLRGDRLEVGIVESGYRADAVSPMGAGGLTQLMPGTAAELGVRDRFDVEQNLSGGADYLARQMLRFGDVRLALAAYNSGPARVARLGRIPDIAETRAYVVAVVDCYLALTAGRGARNARDCRAPETVL